MARKPKPTRLTFGVKTAKRRTHPEEFNVSLKMEHEQCLAWYQYIHAELVKIAKVLESQAYPPGYVAPTKTTTQSEETQEVTINE